MTGTTSGEILFKTLNFKQTFVVQNRDLTPLPQQEGSRSATAFYEVVNVKHSSVFSVDKAMR